jgi:large subunit ribosomal protein L19
MKKQVENFLKPTIKNELPSIKSGDTVRIQQKIKEGDKERIQIFEGLVLARKHGKETGATITVRRVISGIGVEKILPLHSPTLQKIELVKSSKVRRAKLYYLRRLKGKRAKLKKKEFAEIITEEKPVTEELKTEEQK